MGSNRRHRNLPRHSPRRARPAAADEAAVRAEQTAMNELLKKLYGPNARQLCVDGKAGPATNGVRGLLAKAFTNPKPPEGVLPPPLGMDKLQQLNTQFGEPQGQAFRNNPDNTEAFNQLQSGVDGLPESPNGFQPRTGPAPDPTAPVAAAPPAAPEGPPAGPLPAPISGNIADHDVPAVAPEMAPSPAAIAGVTPAPAAAPAPPAVAPPRM